MSDKKEKLVNLDDLESENDYNVHDTIDEVVVDITPKVKLDDIDDHLKEIKKTKNKVKLKPEVRVKFDPSILNGPRFSKYEGNGTEKSVIAFLTNKYTFDKKVIDLKSVMIYICVVLFYFAAEQVETYLVADNQFGEVVVGAARSVILMFLNFYKSTIFLTIIAVFYTFPPRKNTPNLCQIFFDGLTVPAEIFPTVKSSRKRLAWSDIYTIEFKKQKEIPFVQLFGQNKRLLGELRLDVDDLKGFYEKLDTYLPENHVLRILFNNSRKS